MATVLLLLWASGPFLIPLLSQNSTDQTDWAIGRGRMNTSIIIARGITSTYSTPAASACVALRTGEKTDWFLPSRNELHALSQIRGQHGIPNIGVFWSSSQNLINLAWSRNFDNVSPGTSNKNGITNVRAVRAF